MKTIINGKVVKSAFVNGKKVKLLVKNGVVFFRPQTQPQYDESTQAIIDFANSQGFLLPTNLVAVDNLIKAMKASGEWYDLDRFWCFAGDGDLNFKRINWIDPTKPLTTYYGGLTHSVEGIQGNAVNGYVDTNFNPSLMEAGQKYQATDASLIGVNSILATTTSKTFSTQQNDNMSNPLALNQFGSLESNAFRINTGTVFTNSNKNIDLSGTGLKIVQRISSTNIEGINQGVYINNVVQNGSSIANYKQFIFRRYTGYSDAQLQCFAMGKSITFEKSQNFRTAFNEYLTEINLTPIA